MKKFKTFAALAMAATMALTTVALGDAQLDEYGNIIENQPIGDEGQIITLGEEIDLGDWQVTDNDYEDWDFGNFEIPMIGSIFNTVKGQVVDFIHNYDTDELDFIVVEGEYGYTHLRTDLNTFLPGGMPEKGDTITAFHDAYAMVPMIYPPQFLAHAIVVEDAEAETPVFTFLARFNEEKVSFNGERRLIVDEDTEIIFQGGDAFEGELDELFGEFGRMLFVEYSLSHRDINPTTVMPTRIVILYERISFGPEFIGDMLLDVDWDFYYENGGDLDDIVRINGQTDLNRRDLDEGYDVPVPPIGTIDYAEEFNIYDVVVNGVGLQGVVAITIGDSIWPNYLPLRPILDHLGEDVYWNGATRELTVTSPRGIITFRIGFPYFAVEAADGTVTTHTLNDSPIIQNSATLVPISFFREVFGFNNAYFASGVAVINNDEVMQ